MKLTPKIINEIVCRYYAGIKDMFCDAIQQVMKIKLDFELD